MSLKLVDCQDTVVLGKNVRHSFGTAQDRIPPPTRAIIEKRIGNGETGAPVNDHRRASALGQEDSIPNS